MRKRNACLLCAAVLVCLLAGCTYAVVSGGMTQADTYLLYFRAEDLDSAAGGDALRTESVHLPGLSEMEPQQAAQTLMEALLAGPRDEALRSTIPAGTALVSLTLEGQRAVVDMTSGYGALSGVGLAMADYAVALTLTQLPEISTVSVTVRGRELGYRGSQVFSPDDVLLSTTEDVVDTVTATLYLLDETGALRSYETLLELYEGDTQVQAVAAAVEEGAKDAGLFSPMPEGFAVRSVWLDQPVCYVNLSSAVLRDLEDLEAVPLALQALARSLCSLDTVKEVQFLVDGEYADRYASAPVREPYVYTK